MGRRLAAALAVGAAASLCLAGPSFATSPQALTEQALTGLPSVSGVSSRDVCGPAGPRMATCAAQVLTSKATGQPLRGRPPAARSLSRQGTAFGALTGLGASPLSEPSSTEAPAVGTPGYLQQAYDLTALSASAGSGETIGIVDAYGYPQAASDLAHYRSYFGLPACTIASGCLEIVNQAGGSSEASSNTDWDLEQALDLDAVSATCPHCRIVLVQAHEASLADLEVAEAEAASLGATDISNSWTASGPASEAPPASSFTFPGVGVVASTGDQGYDGGADDTSWPAALPTVTAVGGTSLAQSPAPGGRGVSEVAWDGAGSGCADEEKPAWQHDAGCSGRAYADVAADAAPGTGLDTYDSQEGGFVLVGGTSLSDQVVAGYYALLADGAGAGDASWDYANASSLNDITSGSNGGCSAYPGASYLCDAGTGYDGPTGNGSISGGAIEGVPGVAGPGSSSLGYVTSSTSTTATLAAGIYPNQEETTYWIEYGPTTSYGSSTTPVEAGSGSSVVGVTQTLPGLSSSSLYHYRLAAQDASGTAYGYDYVLTTSTTPLDATLPTISGTTTDGDTLSATTGTWASAGPISYSYQWQLCGAEGEACSDIAGATGSSYVVSGADVGLTLDVIVAARSSGVGTATSAVTAQIAGNAPTITTSWTPTSVPTEAPFSTGNGLYALSCPSSSLCVTGDDQGNILHSTAPSEPSESAWASVSVTTRGGITAVSCPTTSLCLAGGPGISGIVVSTDPTGSASDWVTTPVDGGAHIEAGDISCTTDPTLLCVAQDQSGSILSSTDPASGAWEVVGYPAIFYADTLSCPTTTLCVAVSTRGAVMTSTEPTGPTSAWHVTSGFPEGLAGVSCTVSPTLLCIATGERDILTSTDPTGGASSWSSEATDSGGGEIYSAYCLSTSLCLAGDSDGGIISSSDPASATPTWEVERVDGANVIGGISCLSATSCLAVDNDAGGNVLTSTEPTSGAWTVIPVDGQDPYYSVSCPTTSFCASVDEAGNIITTSDPSGTWASAPTSTSTHLEVLSCPSASFCAAGGYGGVVAVSTDPTANSISAWRVSQPDSSTITAITCVGASLCLAGDDTGHILYSTSPASGTWHIVAVDEGHQITAISCPTSTFCVATDSAGNVLTSAQPTSTWSAPTSVDAQPLTALSCPTSTLCVATDSQGAVVTSSDPASSAWALAPIDSGLAIYAISCPTATSCSAVDRGGNVLSTEDPSGGPPSWAKTNLYGGSSPDNGLYSISCPTTSFCVASGATPQVIVGAALLPTVTGTDVDGQALAVTTGTWEGSTPISHSYQWQRCDGAGEACSDIPGATSATYHLTGGDVGSTVGAIVTATNAAGATSADSELTGPVADEVPASTGAPAISGEPTDGQPLTATTGTWSGDDLAYAYQWERCSTSGVECSSLGTADGAQTSAYTPQNEDVGSTLEIVVTATNSAGSATGTSATTAQVANVAPSNTAVPVISGTPDTTSALTGGGDTWLGAQTEDHYHWQRCASPTDPTTCSDIAGASGTTTSGSYSYSPGGADVGAYLRVAVWASDSAGGNGFEVVHSAETAAVAGVAPGAPSTITLSTTAPAYGAPLGISEGAISSAGSPAATYHYQWYDCATSSAGECTTPATGVGASGTSPTPPVSLDYTPDAADIGTTLQVAAWASNEQGTWSGAEATSSTSRSPQTAAVSGVAPSAPPAPALSGGSEAPAYGVTETASGATTSTGTPAASSYAFTWQRCTASDCDTSDGNTVTTIAGAAGSSYTPTSADVGYHLRAQDTATSSQGTWSGTSAPSPYSAPTTSHVSGVAPAAPSAPVLSDTSPAYGSVPISIASGGVSSAGVPAATSYAYDWLRCTDAACDTSDGNTATTIAGATGTAYTPTEADIGYHLEVQVTASNAQDAWTGISATTSSATTAYVTGAAPTTPSMPAIPTDPAYGVPQPSSAAAGSTGTPAPAYSYQWQDCTSGSTSTCTDIAGATSQSYTPGEGDVGDWLRVGVTATSSTGAWSVSSATAYSPESAGYVTGTAPATPSVPVLSDASPASSSGPISIASGGTSAPGTPATTTYSYAWLSCTAPDCDTGSGNTAVVVSTDSTHAPASTDVGHYLEVQVTASNAQGAWTGTSATSTSAVTAYVTGVAPGQPATPTLSTGSPVEGTTISSSEAEGSAPGVPAATSYSYQWQRCPSGSTSTCADIAGATSQSYTPTEGDLGDLLRVGVTAEDSQAAYGAESPVAYSTQTLAPVVPVAHPQEPSVQAPASTSAPVISGTVQAGDVLSTSNGSFTGSDLAYAYTWQRSTDGGATWQPIPGPTGPTYALQAADVGAIVRSTVTATDSAGSATGLSSPTSPVAGSTPPPARLHLVLKVSPTTLTAKSYKRARLAYSLNAVATIHLSLRREGRGHRAGGKCLRGAPSRRGEKSCLWLGKAQESRIAGALGAQSEPLARVIKQSRFVSKATYLLTATAVATGYANAKAQVTVSVH